MAPSGGQLNTQVKDPNAIASQGTDCIGHYASCTAMCEEKEDRPWVEVQPRTGFGVSCSAAIAAGASDCLPGNDGCGNTDPCDLVGVKVDTTAESGTIKLTHNHSVGDKTCVWQIQCPGFASPRLTVVNADFSNGWTPEVRQHMMTDMCSPTSGCWFNGDFPSWFPWGSVSVSDGMGLDDNEGVLLAELVDGSIPGTMDDGSAVLGQVLHAESRTMTITYHIDGWLQWLAIDRDAFTASAEFSAVWFCQ